MKKFCVFLLLSAIVLLPTTLTNSSPIDADFLTSNFENTDGLYAISGEALIWFDAVSGEASLSEIQVTTNNLTALYTICVLLVIINLAAQIKIVLQMIHLFFQFRKKDEFARLEF